MPCCEAAQNVSGCPLAADSIAERFRNQPRSIIGRVKDGCFWIDLRTVNDREIEWICEAARLIN